MIVLPGDSVYTLMLSQIHSQHIYEDYNYLYLSSLFKTRIFKFIFLDFITALIRCEKMIGGVCMPILVISLEYVYCLFLLYVFNRMGLLSSFSIWSEAINMNKLTTIV